MRSKTTRAFAVTTKPKTATEPAVFAVVTPGDRTYSRIDPNDPFVLAQIAALAECGIIEIDFDPATLGKKKATPKPVVKKKTEKKADKKTGYK